MNQGNRIIWSRKAVSLAVISALQSIVMANNAQAACAGSVASPLTTNITLECSGTGTSGNVNNSSAAIYKDTSTVTTLTSPATNFSNTLLQLDGQGRTLDNSGIISNNRVINQTTPTTAARNRVAVLMGAATINAGAGTAFTGSNAANAPTTGVTTVKLNAAPAAGVNLVGQTIVLGRYNAAEGDFANIEQRLVTAYDASTRIVTFADALTGSYVVSTGGDPIGYKVISNFGGGDNVINNSGTISSQILSAEINANKTGTSPNFASSAHTAQSKAITASVEGNYVINNSASGIISAKHDGIGATYAIEEGGAVTEMTINNSGLISAQRTAALTLVDNTAKGNPTAISTNYAGFLKQTVALVNAINTQEEADVLTLNNAATGIVRASGDYAGAIYMRAAEKNITNAGLIEYVGNKGFAIGAVSDGGGIRTLALDNTETGTINGDILVTNGNALRYYLLSTEGGTAGVNNRLLINNQVGQSDSGISNAGHINGNFYYSNGTQLLVNTDTGVINGNIDVDQRNTTYSTTASDAIATGTVVALDGLNTKTKTATGYDFNIAGTKSFGFANVGVFNGNITIRTATGSENALGTVVTASGAGSSFEAPSSNITGFGGTLKVWDGTVSTIATTTTLVPLIVMGVAVKDGEWFKVANNLFGSDLPMVDHSGNTALVSWVVAKNAAGNLVLGAEVEDAATLAGVSGNAGSAINGLVSTGSLLSSVVQGFVTNAEVAAAGEQLRPEVNGARYNAMQNTALQLQNTVNIRIENTRTASNDQSGVSTGEQGLKKGFWLQGFGYTGQQDKRKGVDGYNADGGGFAAGADTLLRDGLRLGAAVSFVNTSVDAKGVNKGNNSNIDSYQAMLYSAMDGQLAKSAWYLNANVAIGEHKVDTKRLVNIGGVIDTPKSNFDAWQYSAKLEGGLPYTISKVITLVPIASLSYSRLNQDGYTEKSNGGAALKISNDDTDSVRTGLGGKALFNLASTSIKTQLEGHAMWMHEFADTRQDTTASFNGGGSAFTTKGVNVDRNAFNLGAILNLSNKEATQTFSVSYDAEIKDQYLSHSGRVQARFDF